jgi:hypothetical protein
MYGGGKGSKKAKCAISFDSINFGKMNHLFAEFQLIRAKSRFDPDDEVKNRTSPSGPLALSP